MEVRPAWQPCPQCLTTCPIRLIFSHQTQPWLRHRLWLHSGADPQQAENDVHLLRRSGLQ